MAREAVIEVVSGPGAGKKLTLPLGKKAIVGRSAEASLSIPDATISRKHVSLEHIKDGVLVKDLGSRHGLTLDGRPVPRVGTLVAVAAALVLGKARLRIARSGKKEQPELPGLRLLEKLGEGFSGEVFAAWQDPPGRRVAVKALPAHADERERKRAARELALEGRLAHPSVVEVHELLESRGRLYLVRELVEGTSLDQELLRSELSWKRACRIGVEIASALAHAHSRGVVHRDVKPGNILLEARSGKAKLADFDCARDAEIRSSLDEATRLTRTGEGLGTLCYIAPEQFQDARRAGEKADVYGLAASLYHALAGEKPFARTTQDDFLRALFATGPTPLEELAPGVPAGVRELVTRGLSPDPEERPDAASLGAALARISRRASSAARARPVPRKR